MTIIVPIVSSGLFLTILELLLGMVRRYGIRKLILPEDGSPTLVARQSVCEIEHLMVKQINEDLTHHILSLFAGQSRGITLPSTEREQCCLTFGVLMGTKFIDRPTRDQLVYYSR